MIRTTLADITDRFLRRVVDVYFRLGWLAGLQKALLMVDDNLTSKEAVIFMKELPNWTWGKGRCDLYQNCHFRRPEWY